MIRMISGGKKYKAIDRILTNFSLGGISDTFDSFEEVLRFKVTYGIILKSEAKKQLFLRKIKHIYNYLKKVLT